MKKFRLFTLLAIIATISTSFAAWIYYDYANEYVAKSNPFHLEVESGFKNMEEVSALKLEITTTTMPKVVFKQAEGSLDVVADIEGDVTVKVTSGMTGVELDQYSYYYTVTTDGENTRKIPNVKHLNEVEQNGSVNYTLLTPIELSEDGTATITAENLEKFFEVDQSCFTKDGIKEEYMADMEEFAASVTAMSYNVDGTHLRFYAKKN